MKKTLLKKAVAVLLTALMLATAIPLSSSASPLNPKSLLILGDSISWGYGLEDTTKRYGDLLAKRLGISSREYVNRAVDGAKSIDLKNTLTSLGVQVAAAELIVISIGGNDIISAFMEIAATKNPDAANSIQTAVLTLAAMSSQELTDLFATPEVTNKLAIALANYNTNINQILITLSRQNPNARVILLNQYDPLNGFQMAASLDIQLKAALLNLNATMAAEAANFGYEIADTYTPFSTATSEYVRIQQYDIHPTEAGHVKIADILSEMLKSYSKSVSIKVTYVPSAEAEIVYSIDFVWGNLSFTYTEPSRGVWNPLTHVYDGVTAGGWSWEEKANVIEVANHSCAPVDVSCVYENMPENNFTVTFDKTAFQLAAPAVSADVNNPTPAPKDAFTITGISGDLAKDAVCMQLGAVTVTVAAADS